MSENNSTTKFSALCYAFERYGGEMRKFNKVQKRALKGIVTTVDDLKAKEFPG